VWVENEARLGWRHGTDENTNSPLGQCFPKYADPSRWMALATRSVCRRSVSASASGHRTPVGHMHREFATGVDVE
jgi:hypothetical protein